MFILQHENGNVIQPGEAIQNFRGEWEVFDSIAQNPSPGKEGKIKLMEGLGVQYPKNFDCVIVEDSGVK